SRRADRHLQTRGAVQNEVTVPFHVPRNGVATDDGLSVSKPDDEDCELQPTAAARARGMSQRIFEFIVTPFPLADCTRGAGLQACFCCRLRSGPPVPANWSSAWKNGARRRGDA